MGSTRLPTVAAIVVSVLIAVAIVAVLAGGDDKASSRPAPGDYVGQSSQKLSFKLTVAPDRTTLTMDVRWLCHGHDGALPFRRQGIPIDADGGFRLTPTNVVNQTDGDEDRQRLLIAGYNAGKSTISGNWSGSQERYNGASESIGQKCDSGPVTFSVHRRDGPAGTDAAGNIVTPLDDASSAGGRVQVAFGAGRAWALQETAEPTVFTIDAKTAAITRRTQLEGASFPMLEAGEGAAWVVEPRRRPARLTRIDARTGKVRRFPVPPTGSYGIEVSGFAVGAGAVWLLHGDRVLRVDPDTGRVVRSIALSPRPASRDRLADCTGSGRPQDNLIAAGAGAVWVISNCRSQASPYGYLLRIDPRANRVTRAVALRQAYGELAAGDGGVWATVRQPQGPAPGASSLQRFSPRTGRPSAIAELGIEYVTGLAVGGDSVWLTQVDERRNGALRRVATGGKRVTGVLALEGPEDVALGAGAAWVVDHVARTVTRVPR